MQQNIADSGELERAECWWLGGARLLVAKISRKIENKKGAQDPYFTCLLRFQQSLYVRKCGVLSDGVTTQSAER